VLESVAGEVRAVTAEFAGAFLAEAESAIDPCFGFVLLGFVAAVARVMLAQVGAADSAVHPARGDQVLGDRVIYRGPFHFSAQDPLHVSGEGGRGFQWDLRDFSRYYGFGVLRASSAFCRMALRYSSLRSEAISLTPGLEI